MGDGETGMMEVEVEKPTPAGHLGFDSRPDTPKSRGATNARADARGNEVVERKRAGEQLTKCAELMALACRLADYSIKGRLSVGGCLHGFRQGLKDADCNLRTSWHPAL